MRHSARLFAVAVLFSAPLISAGPALAQVDESRLVGEAASDVLAKLGSDPKSSTEYGSVFSDEDDKASGDPSQAGSQTSQPPQTTRNPDSSGGAVEEVPLGRPIGGASDTSATVTSGASTAPTGTAASGAAATAPAGSAKGTTAAGQSTAAAGGNSTAGGGFAELPKASASPGFASVERPQARKDVAATAAPKTR